MTAEIVPMVASRCDSVSWVRSDSNCCCNCPSRSVSESASAAEVGGVVLTKECTPLFSYRQLMLGAFRRDRSGCAGLVRRSRTYKVGREFQRSPPPPPPLPTSLPGGE